ncbi:MAG: ATP-binding protein [Gammaproteobacteria bacterium]|nr:ATP-binding protein [Gammaproteobacteria bacterium]
MKQRDFPKPPHSEPIPLADWLDRTDRAEAGREAFFCGRDSEYRVFQKAVSNLNAGIVGGGTMIFQGAPGAGKTALMMECMEAVRLHSTPENPWVAVPVEANTLSSAAAVVRIMIEEADRERERLSAKFPGRVSGSMEKVKDIGQKILSELTERAYTVSRLGRCGLSRPPDERVVNLELLTHEEASEAIENAFESYNFTSSLENPET